MDDDWKLLKISNFEFAFTLLEKDPHVGIVTGLLCSHTMDSNACYGYRGTALVTSRSSLIFNQEV